MLSLNDQLPEIDQVLDRLCTNLSRAISSQTGVGGSDLRRQIGRVRADYPTFLREGEFGDQLLECFTLAYDASVKLQSLAYVHSKLFEEAPVGDIAASIVRAAIMFCLSTEARMIAAIEFKSRDDVDRMMAVARQAFDAARDLTAEADDPECYKQLTQLAGALTNHLYSTALPLPRLVKFTLGKPFPALYVSNRIYYKADRWEEIVDQNRIVNPVFCPREFNGLSN